MVFYGGKTGQADASGKTRSAIDEEVKRLTSDAYQRARVSLFYSVMHLILVRSSKPKTNANIFIAAYIYAQNLLKKHAKEHKLLAETLLEYETLTGDEVRVLVLKGKKPDRPKDGSRGDQTFAARRGTMSHDARGSRTSIERRTKTYVDVVRLELEGRQRCLTRV